MIQEVLAAVSPTPIVVDLANVGVGIPADTSVGLIIGNAIRIIMMIALIGVLAMLIFGAFQWIVSGGEKEKVASARGRITNALIGLAILGLAFVIVTVAGNLVNINIFDIKIPNLANPAP
ncbi:MAG: hypothetical protein PHQ59_00750 [Candidatus Daviesbacteria bacterium]|nr:hypothetical protein [Candidatus Daviesbacteria bacterium]